MGRTSDANVRLMQAAVDLIWEASYGTVSIDDICHRAGVKKGSFYYFFKSKSELAIAALEKLWTEDWKPKLDTIFSPSVEPLTRITNHLESVYQRQAEGHKLHGKVLGCPVCSVGSEMSTQEEELTSKVRELFARKRRYFESAIRDAMAEGLIEQGDAAAKANAYSCLIEGAMTQARIMNNPELLRDLPRAAFDLLRVKTAPVATAAR